MNAEEFEEIVADLRENQHLINFTIENKKEYISDLQQIVYSSTGRGDLLYSNKFFHEAQTLIINAISLFEKGYFDCSFYSLRQSIEVSLTIAFLADSEDYNNQIELYRKWMKKEKFPMQGQMIAELKKSKRTYADIKEKMTDFFSELEAIKNRLNKYVHKQGYDTFHGDRSEAERKNLKNEFIEFLEISITAIAVHRLVIDPLPILLMDQNIYEKSVDMITESFSEDFVKKYLDKYLAQYKTTEMYIGFYDYFDAKETLLPSVLNLVKDQYFDREASEEILSQKDLLTYSDKLAVGFFGVSLKISHIYMGSFGLNWYFSDVKTVRLASSFKSSHLKIAKESKNPMNNKYYEAYLSFIQVDDEEIYIQHNEIFEEFEIEVLQTVKMLFEKAIEDANIEIEKLISSIDKENK